MASPNANKRKRRFKLERRSHPERGETLS
jgi:hypothetical protein